MTPEKEASSAINLAVAGKKPYPWRCPECGRIEVQPATIVYDIEVKHDGRLHKLHIPALSVSRCGACGEILFSNLSDDQVSQALRDHLGLLSPEQIRDSLATLNLKQKELAERIGVAPETVSRWLSGCQIQSRAMDNLMRLFFKFDNVRAELAGSPATRTITGENHSEFGKALRSIDL